MANEEHLAILKQGVKVWNKWREKHPTIQPDLEGADLTGADLREADLTEAQLGGAHLGGAHLMRAQLMGADLTGADLMEADLTGADLRGANLGGADLTEAQLGGAYLMRAHLKEAYLIRAHLMEAYLLRADLTEAHLTGADLKEADLTEAYIGGAELREADLTEAHLGGAVLTKVDFRKANLRGAHLRGADLTNSIMGFTNLANIDLSFIMGLEKVIHVSPSSIGIDTVYRSKGKIPEKFLRGAGIPDSFITYMASLTGEALQYYSCCISYSTNDQAFAERLHTDLQSRGVRCWFAPEDIQGGRKLHEQIPEAIRIYDKLLLVLSEYSMVSEWVKTEIYHARQDEIRNGKRKLFPIGLIGFNEIREWEAFDADVGKDMAREVREYFIPDFSNWKDHDDYTKAFDRLLRDLKQQTDVDTPGKGMAA